MWNIQKICKKLLLNIEESFCINQQPNKYTEYALIYKNKSNMLHKLKNACTIDGMVWYSIEKQFIGIENTYQRSICFV